MIVEFESILSETEHFHTVVVEVCVELSPIAAEAALVHIAPYGLHQGDDSDVIEMIIDDEIKVLVERIKGHCVLIGQNGVHNDVIAQPGEGMRIEQFLLAFVKLYDGYEQYGRVDHDLYL